MPRPTPARYTSVVLALLVIAACDDLAACLSALQARQAGWQRDVAHLRATTSELEERFARVNARPIPGAAPEAAAQRLRTESVLRASRVTLSDVDLIARQSNERVETGARASRDGCMKELDAVTSRVSAALAGIRAQLAQAAVDVSAMERQLAEQVPGR